MDQLNYSDLLFISIDRSFNVTAHISFVVLILLAVILLILIYIKLRNSGFFGGREFEIDEAQFGIGNQKIKLRPNDLDRQVAYKIWVELSTRKIGLPIDLNNDVIAEVYDSWYKFFSVTRELIKDIPASKLRKPSTKTIVALSIEVLNNGLRPHLTQWQARFRRWYDRELDRKENADLHPQDIQKNFPDFEGLRADLNKINKNLIHYREKMHELVSNF